jgi:hypothetical protein
LLGPAEVDSVWEYEEVGRAMASLFIDKVTINSCLTVSLSKI